jgi:hypothetical protein
MKSVITSAQVQFEILVGEYSAPKSGSGQYCEMGVRNMQTGEMGVLICVHSGDLPKLPKEVVDNADWIVSCFLPEASLIKSVFGKDASGKQICARLRKDNVLVVYLIGEHTSFISVSKLKQKINLSKGIKRFIKENERNMKLSVSSVKDRVLRLASYLSSKGMQYVGVAYEVWKQNYSRLVNWNNFSSLF